MKLNVLYTKISFSEVIHFFIFYSSFRACFKKLPRILSFNTMRYTFNMVTMMKEKVNTHFSFPLRLDMTLYTEDFLMAKGDRKEGTPGLSFCVQGLLYLTNREQIVRFP